MSEEDKKSAPSKPFAEASPNPESPTTARPLDFDDEPQESGTTAAPASAEAPPNDTEDAPPKPPPRPLSPRQVAENTLVEAFPSVDAAVVKAVLMASSWDVERGFHALLAMTDPNAEQDMPPSKPPRPALSATPAARSQVESDELYARQLAEHYNRRRAPRPDWDAEHQDYRRGSVNSEERDYSFFDDDLPVIRDNIRKGFVETQSKVNTWVQNLKKRIDGEEVDDEEAGQSYNEAQGYSRPRHSGDLGRRSGDRERYDADPQVLSDDFTALELRDTEVPPPRPPRPTANPALQKSSSPDRRKVSFHEGPPTKIDDVWDAPPAAKRVPSGGSKPSKWQPLSTMEPSPVAENDPFSLGDSDDEKDGKAKDHNTAAEGDHIKEATAEAMAGEIGSGSKDDSKADGSGK